MEANVTSPQSEPDQDNSSLQNPSTNPAEAGTTDETRDEEHETSSIEALNWSEVEEEELAAAQQAEALAAKAKLAEIGTAKTGKVDIEDENTNGSSTNGSTVLVTDEGNVLSTSLLQSINSTVSDEDPQARKLSVIENWASEVTNAVERGEIEITEDFPDDNGTVDGELEEPDNEVRQRKSRKLSPEMISSKISTASNAESSVDPMSNAPVLDDGPIWNKGPRSYTFQENRRINQKLTFCLLIAVVLAIGLGLGNLVAHQECEAEFKTQQPPPPMNNEPVSEKDQASINQMHANQPFKSLDPQDFSAKPDRNLKPATPKLDEKNDRSDDPIIDPKYRVHAETLSRVVHTLDQLSRKIDQFENTTRKLQGVLVIPDEEKSQESATTQSSLYDEQVFRDEEEDVDEEDDEQEMAMIDDLVDAIEQTPNYLDMKKTLERIEELDKVKPLSRLFSETKSPNAERKLKIDQIEKAIQQMKDFERRFVQSERKLLKDEGRYDTKVWRTPEEYTDEEKRAIGKRYRSSLEEFHKLLEEKNPDPIYTLFGVEEEDEERNIEWPFPNTDDGSEYGEDYPMQFAKNLEEAFGFKEGSLVSEIFPEAANLDKPISTPEPETENIDAEPSSEPAETTDDLIVIEPIDKLVVQASEKQDSAQGQHQDVGNNHGKLPPVESQVESETPKNLDASHETKPVRNKRETKAKVSKGKDNSNPNSATKQSNKSKKSGSKASVVGNNGNPSQSTNGKNGKRDQKTKEQKKLAKQKIKVDAANLGSSNNGNNVNNNGKAKMNGKLKKLKSLESNKVFDTIKGKNTEKRRSDINRGKDIRSAENKYADTNRGTVKEKRNVNRGKKASGESTKNVVENKKSGSKPNNNVNYNSPNHNQKNNAPIYDDSRDVHAHQNAGTANEKKETPKQVKTQDPSSKEAPNRQQKHDFNNGNKPYRGNPEKKSKNWQNKERDRRERTSSWGN